MICGVAGSYVIIDHHAASHSQNDLISDQLYSTIVEETAVKAKRGCQQVVKTLITTKDG